jgi:glyceraldehyde 3-phosphate dehydrogenase
MKIAINGFGRIGRTITRINYKKNIGDIVLINDLIPSIKNIAYLLKYDSNFGNFSGDITYDKKHIYIDNKKIAYSTSKDISFIRYPKDLDIFIDCSGYEKNIQTARKLIKKKKFKKYIFTMTSSGVDKEIILGVNDQEIKSKYNIYSSSICDSNAIAHIIKYFNDKFIIQNGTITTLHPWLTYQNLLDGAAKGISPDPNKYTPDQKKNAHLINNFALGRSSINALIPKKTTAISVTEKIIPSIKGKIFSHSFRVPTSLVSCADIYLQCKKPLKNKIFLKNFKDWITNNKYLSLCTETLISKDFEKNEKSAIIDQNWLQFKDNKIKIILWYDNEWGYSSRVLDLAEKIII